MDNIELADLFENNRAWAAQQTELDARFFTALAQQQRPKYLWIGCADSRVPANEIVGLPQGQVFVHRNIANVVVHSDLNCLSVIQYAVDVLCIEHIIVTGHYGCGGVAASVDGERHGLIDNWLRHIQDVAHQHPEELAAIQDTTARLNRLCELNVESQVRNVARTTIVQDAWARGQNVALHGWVYDLNDGLLRDLNVTTTEVSPLKTMV